MRVVERDLAEDRQHHQQRRAPASPSPEVRRERTAAGSAPAPTPIIRRCMLEAVDQRAHQHLREGGDGVDHRDQRADAEVGLGQRAQALVEHLRHRDGGGVEDHAAAGGGDQQDGEDARHGGAVDVQADGLRLLLHRARVAAPAEGTRRPTAIDSSARDEERGAPAPQVHQRAGDDAPRRRGRGCPTGRSSPAPCPCSSGAATSMAMPTGW